MFHIFLTDVLLLCSTDVVKYANDKALYATGKFIHEVLQQVEKVSGKLTSSLTIKWSLTLTNAIYGAAITDEVSFKIENETKNVLQVKVFGIAIQNNPTLEPHVENFCRKAREKPYVLAKIANYKCMPTKGEVLCVHISE